MKHSHKPNFGRFVAGCPKCEAKGPAPKKGKAAKAPPIDASGNVTISYEVLQALMAAKAGGNADLAEALKAFAIELRRPDADEVAQKENARTRLAERKRLRLIEIQAEEDSKQARWAACGFTGHVKENGRTAIHRGQLHSDGLYHPFCQHCFKQFPTVAPSRGELSGSTG